MRADGREHVRAVSERAEANAGVQASAPWFAALQDQTQVLGVERDGRAFGVERRHQRLRDRVRQRLLQNEAPGQARD
jgi:hypothetical protein